MRVSMMTDKQSVKMSVYVRSIEMTEPLTTTYDDGYKDYQRVVRFNLGDGQSFDIVCTCASKAEIEPTVVKKLPKLRKSRDTWLTPKVYKGEPQIRVEGE